MLCLVCFKGALDTRHFAMDPSLGDGVNQWPRAYDDDSEGDKSELFW